MAKTVKQANIAPKHSQHAIASHPTGHKVVNVDGEFRLLDSSGAVLAKASTLDEIQRDYRTLAA